MRILIACEESGVVTTAFRQRRHEVFSCDLLPSRGNPEWHICSPAEELLFKTHGRSQSERVIPWDMVIAFPPCTALAVSGARYFAQKKADGRQQAAIDFFMLFVRYQELTGCKMAIENPVGIMSTVYRKPNQIIHPWQFGHDASKKTCLWLFDLPLLVPTNIIAPGLNGRYGNQTPSGQNKLSPGPNRARDRAITYVGIAEAMASQWR